MLLCISFAKLSEAGLSMLVLQTPGRCSNGAGFRGPLSRLVLFLVIAPLVRTSALAAPSVCLCSCVFGGLWLIVRRIDFPLAFSELALALWWWFEIQFGGTCELSISFSFPFFF